MHFVENHSFGFGKKNEFGLSPTLAHSLSVLPNKNLSNSKNMLALEFEHKTQTRTNAAPAAAVFAFLCSWRSNSHSPNSNWAKMSVAQAMRCVDVSTHTHTHTDDCVECEFLTSVNSVVSYARRRPEQMNAVTFVAHINISLVLFASVYTPHLYTKATSIGQPLTHAAHTLTQLHERNVPSIANRTATNAHAKCLVIWNAFFLSLFLVASFSLFIIILFMFCFARYILFVAMRTRIHSLKSQK